MKLPVQGFATGQDPGAFGQRIADMKAHFFQCSGFNQRALGHAFFKAIAHFQGLDFGGEFGQKSIVDSFLNVNPIRAHAGLAGIAKFAGHGTFHSRVNVGIFKHNERRIAAQLQRQFFHSGRRLRHQDAAHLGGTGEAQVAHHIAVANHLANGDAVIAVRAQHIQYPSG